MQETRRRSPGRRALALLLSLLFVCTGSLSAMAAGGTQGIPDGKIVPKMDIQYYETSDGSTISPISGVDSLNTTIWTGSTVSDFDSLYSSSGYTLSEVHLLNSGRQPTSTKVSDWTVYGETSRANVKSKLSELSFALYGSDEAKKATTDKNTKVVIVDNEDCLRYVYTKTDGAAIQAEPVSVSFDVTATWKKGAISDGGDLALVNFDMTPLSGNSANDPVPAEGVRSSMSNPVYGDSDEAPYMGIVSDETGFVTFGAFTYTTPGTYRYQMHPGWVPDSNTDNDYEIAVEVTDTGRGHLAAGITTERLGSGVISNTGGIIVDYFAGAEPITPYTFSFPQLKATLDGRDMRSSDEFTFSLTPDDPANPMPKNENSTVQGVVSAVVTDCARGTFNDITFANEGTYGYTLRLVEGVTANESSKIEYSDMTCHFTVTVTKNGTVLSGESDLTSSEIVFPCSMKPQTLSESFTIEKVITGRNWGSTDRYDFKVELVSNGGSVVNSYPRTFTIDSSVDGVGSVDVPIQFLKVGTGDDGRGDYVFRVSEVVPDNLSGDTMANMTFDSNSWLLYYTLGYDENDNMVVVSSRKENASSGRNASTQVLNGAVLLDPNSIEDATVPLADAPGKLTVRFTNVYAVQPVNFDINATSRITGRKWQSGDTLRYKFEETSTGADCLTNPEVLDSTPDKGNLLSFTFTPQYSMARQHTYKLTEEVTNGTNLTRDESEYVITVDVGQNDNGSLSPSIISITKDGLSVDAIEFEHDATPVVAPTPTPTPGTGDEMLFSFPIRLSFPNHKLSGDDMLKFSLISDVSDGVAFRAPVANGDAMEYQDVYMHDITLDMNDGFFGFEGMDHCDVTLPAAVITGPGTYYAYLKQTGQGGAFEGCTTKPGMYILQYQVTDVPSADGPYTVRLGFAYMADENADIEPLTQCQIDYEFEPVSQIDALTFAPIVGVRLTGREWADTDDFMVRVEPVTPEGSGYMILGDPTGQREIGITKGYVKNNGTVENPSPELKYDNVIQDGAGNVVGYFSQFGVRFFQDGTYTVRVKQADYAHEPRGDGVIRGYGIKYDTHYWTVTFTVDMSAGSNGVTFSAVRSDGKTLAEVVGSDRQCLLLWDNVYTAGTDTFKLEGTMTVTGREFKEADSMVVRCVPKNGAPAFDAGETYVITESGNSVSFDFGNVHFTDAGTYTYEITVDPDAAMDGVAVDRSVYTLVLTVTDNGDGTFSVTHSLQRDGEPVDSLVFEHEVPVDSVLVPMGLSVKLTGREWNSSDSFAFGLSPKNSAAVSGVESGDITFTNTEKTVTSSNGPSYSTTFGDVSFSKAGTYTFDIACTTTMGGGMTIEKSTIPVEVTVVDNGGTLEATYKVDGKTATSIAPVFKMTYSASGVETDIAGSIKLDGRPFEEGDAFTFIIGSSGHQDMEVTLNDIHEGTVNPLPFAITLPEISAPGEYTYTLAMKEGDLECVEYSKVVYTIKVTVTDNGDGTLSSSYEVVGGGKIQFVNTYNETMPDNVVTAVRLSAEVDLSGRDWKESDTFNIDLEPYDDVTRNAVENGDIEMPENTTAVVSETNHEAFWDNVLFHNVGTYKFKATQQQGTWGGLVYDLESYIITVVTDYSRKDRLTATSVTGVRETSTVQDMAAYVDKNENGEYDTGVTGSYKCVFYNTYTPAPATLNVQSTIKMTGRSFAAGDTFKVKLACPELNVNETKTVTPTSGGSYNLSFEPMVFTEPGTYYYTVSQEAGDLEYVTYDNTVYRVKVTVVDGTMGKLWASSKIEGGASSVVFTNTYEEPIPDEKRTSVELNVSKSIRGRDWAGVDAFEFELSVTDKITQRAINDGDIVMPSSLIVMTASGSETVAFNPIVFKDTGLYSFVLAEKSGTAGGITYDANKYTINVTVEDTGDGLHATVDSERSIENVRITALAEVLEGIRSSDTGVTGRGTFPFENFYETSDAVVNVSGDLSAGKDFNEGTYTVALGPNDKTGTEPPVENASLTLNPKDNGHFDFGEMTYDKAGTYYYTMTITNDKTGESESFEIAVVVKDNNEGALSAVVNAVTSAGATVSGGQFDVTGIVTEDTKPDPSESPEPSTEPSTQPSESPSPSPKPSDEPGPSESPKPSDKPEPSESPSPKPSDKPDPSESPSPKPDVKSFSYGFAGVLSSGDKSFYSDDMYMVSLESTNGSDVPDETSQRITVMKEAKKLAYELGSVEYSAPGVYEYDLTVSNGKDNLVYHVTITVAKNDGGTALEGTVAYELDGKVVDSEELNIEDIVIVHEKPSESPSPSPKPSDEPNPSESPKPSDKPDPSESPNPKPSDEPGPSESPEPSYEAYSYGFMGTLLSGGKSFYSDDVYTVSVEGVDGAPVPGDTLKQLTVGTDTKSLSYDMGTVEYTEPGVYEYDLVVSNGAENLQYRVVVTVEEGEDNVLSGEVSYFCEGVEVESDALDIENIVIYHDDSSSDDPSSDEPSSSENPTPSPKPDGSSSGDDGSSSMKPTEKPNSSPDVKPTTKPTSKPDDGSKIDLNAGVGNNMGVVIVIICVAVTACVLGVCLYWLRKKRQNDHDDFDE